MFTGFNLDLSKNTNIYGGKIIDFSAYETQGRNHLNLQKANYESSLKNYILNGTADGTKLQDDWFPQVTADIFISHSHKDLKLAEGLAGWLNKKFDLDCFIDSNVWGYADKLLEQINDNYSDREDKTSGYGCIYNHQKCNIASKHVNTMLSIALQKMIDKTEATFVLNTPNSIDKYEDVYETSTYSPWIYTEIICTEIVRKKSLLSYRPQGILKHAYESAEFRAETNSEYNAAYKISLSHLAPIDIHTLNTWRQNMSSTIFEHSLDELYNITHPNEMKKLVEFYNKKSEILF